jgi:hypothetical protein
VLLFIKKVIHIGSANMPNSQIEKQQLKAHQIQKIFQGIDDEIAILTATAKFNQLTCKTNANNLTLTLAYIEDTKRLATVLKNRITRLTEATSSYQSESKIS